MNFSEIWDEHKKFILGLGAAALVFMIANGVLGSMYYDAADDAEGRGKKLKTRLASIPDPATGAIAKVRKQKEDLEQRLEAARKRIETVRGEDFELPASRSDADLRYNAVAQGVREEVVDVAATLDIVIDPTLGLPEFTPASRGEINGYLAGLSVVDQICRLSIDEGVDAVAPIRIVPGTVTRFDRGESFLEKVHVEMQLTGSADAVASVIKKIQMSDPVIPLGESSLRLNEGGTTVSADLLLYAVVVHPDRPVDSSRSRGRRRRS